MPDLTILRNREVVDRIDPDLVVGLVESATSATFYRPGMPADQIAANARIPGMGADAVFGAAGADHQHLAAAFDGDRLAGFVIATRHDQQDLELDWLMVDPRFHGSGISATLMHEGIAWLGDNRPMWLTVLQHNLRAIAFYRKFGFEIDLATELDRIVPTFLMRRSPTPPQCY